MTEEQPQTKRRQGCLFYGCLCGLVLLLVVVIAGLIGLRYAKKMYYEFTDSQPIALPEVKLSQPEIEALRHKVDDFRESVKAGRHTRPLTLTADEINALIAGDKDLKAMKGKFYVSLENDQIKAQLSVPLDELNLPIFKGRYLNGAATLSLFLRDGTLYLIPQDITVKGKPLPSVYSQSIRKQNLAQDMDNDPKASDALKQIQSIEVKNGELTIVPKESPK
jgi:hypothetical protein